MSFDSHDERLDHAVGEIALFGVGFFVALSQGSTRREQFWVVFESFGEGLDLLTNEEDAQEV